MAAGLGGGAEGTGTEAVAGGSGWNAALGGSGLDGTGTGVAGTSDGFEDGFTSAGLRHIIFPPSCRTRELMSDTTR